MLKKTIIVLAIVILIFSIHQMFTAREVTHGNQTTVTFTGVPLNCKQCQTRAQLALSNLLGIKTSHVFPKRDMIKVTFNSNIMKANWIANSLTAAGFKPGHMKVNQR